MRILLRCLVGLVLLAMLGWATLAIYYSNISSPGLRLTLSSGFCVSMLAGFLFLRPWRRAIQGFVIVFAGVLVCWLFIPASNDRAWEKDVAVLPYATFDGDAVTIHNIRNNDYRSETDFSVQYYDKTFQLSQLRTVDLALSYWGSPMIAHTIISFGFADNEDVEYVAISIETRKNTGEEYSTLKGFFKQYELIYVIANERDLIRLRTNYRGEDVYLYRIDTPAEVIRQVFVDYLRQANRLKERPEWYNALTQNCTTAILARIEPYAVRSWWGWKLLVNGYLDELAYDLGAIDQSLSFQELKQRSLINERGQAADTAPDFSNKIRVGLPGT